MEKYAYSRAQMIEDCRQVRYHKIVSDSGRRVAPPSYRCRRPRRTYDVMGRGAATGTHTTTFRLVNDTHCMMRVVLVSRTTSVSEPASSSDLHLMFCALLKRDHCSEIALPSRTAPDPPHIAFIRHLNTTTLCSLFQPFLSAVLHCLHTARDHCGPLSLCIGKP
jgi:hypothetical protein